MSDKIFRKAVLQLLVTIANYLVRQNYSIAEPKKFFESQGEINMAIGYAKQALRDDES